MRARGIENLSTEARHEMRKEIKNFRYLSEILPCLYPNKKVGAFNKALRNPQEGFGALNEAAMAQALLSGPDPPGVGDPEAQRAAGRLIGALPAGAGHRSPRAVADWRALADLGPFWR